mmetsp:Transcript_3293/g.9462  ORF Transcript_3293/g.9462 Transcript_3293/m.9462 type:complete len:527 (+) Transcript_3293:633-2213(+)
MRSHGEQQRHTPHGTPLPPLPASFEITASAALVAGLDMAALLPASAAAPRPVVLPSLADDVLAATAAVRKAANAEDVEGAIRSARWALKRILRAAFEASAEHVEWYTRDLYWCCHAGCISFPELEGRLVELLEAYAKLSGRGAEMVSLSSALLAADLSMSVAESLLKAYWSRTLDDGSGKVERALALLPLSTWSEKAVRPPGRSQLGGFSASIGHWLRQGWFAVQSQLSDIEAAMPPKGTKVSRAHEALEEVRATDCRLMAGEHQMLLLTPEGELPNEPVLLCGAAAHWPAVTRWSLRYLAAKLGFEGLVRVAPTHEFPFCEPALLQVLVDLLGEAAAPSLPVKMSAAEFAVRLRGGVAPRVYMGGEQYYMQADLTRELLADVEFKSGVFAELWSRRLDRCPPGRGDMDLPRRLCWGQQPRAWISGPGSVSPIHYDSSPSFLVQVRGEKRMLFWHPDELPSLRPFPSTHLMRRRCQTPLGAAPPPRLATLGPGDAVFFPPLWAHYTESTSLSFSITARLRQGPAGQ